MESTLGNRVVRITLRLGLAGLGMLLWHAPAAKAQDCCPDNYTEAEMAKVKGSAKKPVKQLVKNDKSTKPVLVAKAENGGAAGTKVSGKENPSKSAKIVPVKQPVNTNEKKQ